MERNYFFDTHAHLADDVTLESAREYLARAEQSNVREILLCTTHEEQIERYKAFVETSPRLYFTVGIHPLDLVDGVTYSKAPFLPFATHPQMIAVGEIGLDYYYEGASRDRQMEIFALMLDMALEMDKPAVVHTRDKMDCFQAYEDAYALLKPFSERGGRFELHSYAGNAEYLKKFIDLGAFFGINGMITFKKSDNIREVAIQMPKDRILLETDSPYLAPVPFRGKTNHPEYTACTGAFTANLFGMTKDALAELTTASAHKFFRIPEAQ